MKFTLKKFTLMAAFLCILASGSFHIVAAQTSAPPQAAMDLSTSLENLTNAAADLLPAFVKEVERPLGGYFELLGWWLAWLVFMIGFLKMLRESDGGESMWWFFARGAVCFALLAACGDTNGDGLRGDLINNIDAVGNSVAYGQLGGKNEATSFLENLVETQEDKFDKNYQDFLNNAFTAKVPCSQLPNPNICNPNTGEIFQRLKALYSGGDSLTNLNQAVNPAGWNMSTLFEGLNFSRGVIEFGDLFLLVLQGFLVSALRLAAPFMVAVAIDREWAKRMSNNFAWSVIIVCLVMPVISQIIRFMSYLAANMAMDTQSAAPYYNWDASTLQIIAAGNPIYMIMIAGLIMLICGLCMFASPYLSYKLANGQIAEAVTGAVAGWMGAIVGTGISTYSSAASASMQNQSAQMQSQNQAETGGLEARGNAAAAAVDANARASAGIQNSRATEEEQKTSAGITNYAANEREQTSFDQTAEKENVGLQSTITTTEGELAGGAEKNDLERGQVALHRVENTPIIGGPMASTSRTVQSAFHGLKEMGAGAIFDTNKGTQSGKGSNPNPMATGGASTGGAAGAHQPTGANAPRGNAPSQHQEQQPQHHQQQMNAGGGDPRGQVFQRSGDSHVPFNGTVSNEWGAKRSYGGHTGTDLAWHAGEKVGAAGGGRVVFAGKDGGYGNRVVVDHGNGRATTYNHLQNGSTDGLRVGDSVGYGQTIGRVGNTGHSTGATGNHLHFETGKLTGGTDKNGAPNMQKFNARNSDFRPVRGGGEYIRAQEGGGLTASNAGGASYGGVALNQGNLAARAHELRGKDWERRKAETPYLAESMTAAGKVQGATDQARGNIEASRGAANRNIVTNNWEGGQRSALAGRMGGLRERAIETERSGSLRSNEMRQNVQLGDKNAPVGSLEWKGAIASRHEAANNAAAMQAVGSVAGSIGSNLASQMQGVFNTFNRF